MQAKATSGSGARSMKPSSSRPVRKALPGATVFRSPMGFGATSRIHTAKILILSTDLPIVVEIIDAAPKIEAFLARLGGMIQGGMVTVEPVRVVHYEPERKE
jgi:PII-like signaling protein